MPYGRRFGRSYLWGYAPEPYERVNPKPPTNGGGKPELRDLPLPPSNVGQIEQGKMVAAGGDHGVPPLPPPSKLNCVGCGRELDRDQHGHRADCQFAREGYDYYTI